MNNYMADFPSDGSNIEKLSRSSQRAILDDELGARIHTQFADQIYNLFGLINE